MQRYSRDRDRDDEGGRAERGSQARDNDERFSQGSDRGSRDEFGGRGGAEYERRSSYRASAYGTSPGSSRWRELGGERDPFDRQYGSGEQRDYYTGGAWYGGRQSEDERSDWRGDRGRSAWQPGRQTGEPRRGQYGETDYGAYGPRYGSSFGDSRYGGRAADERGDDRFGRQGYGQPEWQHEHEREVQDFDPDYLRWRAEQIRNLDRDYQRYRQERFKKFSDDFGSWRKSQESVTGSSAIGNPQQSGTHDLAGTLRDSPLTSKSNK